MTPTPALLIPATTPSIQPFFIIYSPPLTYKIVLVQILVFLDLGQPWLKKKKTSIKMKAFLRELTDSSRTLMDLLETIYSQSLKSGLWWEVQGCGWALRHSGSPGEFFFFITKVGGIYLKKTHTPHTYPTCHTARLEATPRKRIQECVISLLLRVHWTDVSSAKWSWKACSQCQDNWMEITDLALTGSR